jgi:hypothetical protein
MRMPSTPPRYSPILSEFLSHPAGCPSTAYEERIQIYQYPTSINTAHVRSIFRRNWWRIAPMFGDKDFI